jgi:predicted phosphodiesterase
VKTESSIRNLKRYAVLSDIHGNIWALEAVLADAVNRGLQRFINLGDTVYGPLEPQATAERLMKLSLFSIQGNQDRALSGKSDFSAFSTLEYVWKALAPQSHEWLASQPGTFVIGKDLFLCHGTPRSDETYLLESMSREGGFLKEPSCIRAHLAPVTQTVVLCGHSHIPRAVQLPDGRLIVNPGSVGLPAYSDEAPVAHKMETGSPHARYAVLSEATAGWTVEQMAIPYEWKKAAEKARRQGRNDWAEWLESGRA